MQAYTLSQPEIIDLFVGIYLQTSEQAALALQCPPTEGGTDDQDLYILKLMV